MKKRVLSIVFVLGTLLSAPSAMAQATLDTMDIPHGKFETWINHPADTLSLMGMMNFPVNYDYQLPQGWSVPMYTVNENFSYMGMSIPIHVTIPLAMVSADEDNAPEGEKGLVVRSFRLQDIITPTVYSMVSGSLDSSLTGVVLPSIASTGEINMDSVFPLLDRLFDQSDNLAWLLDLVDSINIDNYLSGGFPLNGFKPGKLIGKYKYYDPDDGIEDDNGGVFMIGTRYDTLQHRRMLVGAGQMRLYELYDSVNYEFFEFEYTSLSEYFPESYGYYEADSMIVIAISSSSDKVRRYGSRLYLDDLKLVSRPTPCGRVENFHEVTNAPMYLQLAWNNTATPDSWEIEYGARGFTRGFGTTMTLSDSTVVFNSLATNTWYDFYVHGLCGDTAETEWVYLSVLTDSIPTIGIDKVGEGQVKIYPNPAVGRCNVDLKGVQAREVRLYGIEGRLVEVVKAAEGDMVEFSLPAKGIYFVEIVTDGGRIHKRVVSQ